MVVWISVDMLRLAALCLVLVYLTNDSCLISMDVVIHLFRCGLAIVLRCPGLSKVRCGGEGLVLHGVWQVLESAKDSSQELPPGLHVSSLVQYGMACRINWCTLKRV
jgi:hypothetical protein